MNFSNFEDNSKHWQDIIFFANAHKLTGFPYKKGTLIRCIKNTKWERFILKGYRYSIKKKYLIEFLRYKKEIYDSQVPNIIKKQIENGINKRDLLIDSVSDIINPNKAYHKYRKTLTNEPNDINEAISVAKRVYILQNLDILISRGNVIEKNGVLMNKKNNTNN